MKHTLNVWLCAESIHEANRLYMLLKGQSEALLQHGTQQTKRITLQRVTEDDKGVTLSTISPETFEIFSLLITSLSST